MSAAPGTLFRGLDRLLRTAADGAERDVVLDAVARHVDRVSGRVLLGVREHLQNRATPDASRIFVNRGARAWVADDRRAPLDPAVVARVPSLLAASLVRRFPPCWSSTRPCSRWPCRCRRGPRPAASG